MFNTAGVYDISVVEDVMYNATSDDDVVVVRNPEFVLSQPALPEPGGHDDLHVFQTWPVTETPRTAPW